MDLTPIFILGSGIALGFFAQTVAGFGAGLISLPILLLVSDLQDSMALLSLFLFLFSVILVYQNRRLIDKKIIFEIFIGAVLGLFVGIQVLKFGNPDLLKKLLGLFIILYVFYSLIKKKKIEAFKKLGFLFSFLGGFFSGLYSSGGPLFITYIHNKVEKIKVVRATLIGTLAITNTLRIPLLIQTDILDSKVFSQAIYMLPFFLVSVYLGTQFYNKINENLLKKFFLILLFASGVALIFR